MSKPIATGSLAGDALAIAGAFSGAEEFWSSMFVPPPLFVEDALMLLSK
jgi:hypothetical protein